MFRRRLVVVLLLLLGAALTVVWRSSVTSPTRLADLFREQQRLTFVVSNATIDQSILTLESAQAMRRNEPLTAADASPFAGKTLVFLRNSEEAERLLRTVPELIEYDGEMSGSDFVYDLMAPVNVNWSKGNVSIVQVTGTGMVRSITIPAQVTRVVFRRDTSIEQMFPNGFGSH